MSTEAEINANEETNEELQNNRIISTNFSFSLMDLNRVSRLISEAFDLTLVLATMFVKTDVTTKWILDMIDQILPTAYVYNTGFWPMYNIKDTNEYICLCDLFDINCTHTYNDFHCLKMNDVQLEEADYRFKLPKDVTSQNCIVATEVDGIYDGYVIRMKLEDLENRTITKIYMRVLFKPCLYDISSLKLVLTPHPLRLNIYGVYVRHLGWDYMYNYPNRNIPETFIIDGEEAPTFTLVVDKQTIDIVRSNINV